MQYILAAAVIFGILFFVPLLFGVLSNLTKKQIVLVYSGVAVLIVILMFFTIKQTDNQNTNLDVMKAFQRGETVICDSIEVDSSDYTLVIGTLNFVGKNGTDVAGRVFKIENCVVK